MTLIQSRQNVDEVAGRPANDNQTPNLPDFPVLDLVSSGDEVVDMIRRAERLALAVIIAMAIFLIFTPVVFIALV
nr:hypothetical protein [Mesorhizobium tianshanense]